MTQENSEWIIPLDVNAPGNPVYVKILMGQIIKNIEVSTDKNYFYIHLMDGKTHHFRTEGDCCSCSWIEHLTAPNDLEGAAIIGFKELYIDSFAQEGEYIKVYNTCFRTMKGDITLEYRNSSNGYYGGSLDYQGVING